MSSVAILHASQLITLVGPKRPRVERELSELAIIRDGGMLIHDGKIDMVGPSDQIEKNAGAAEIVDAHGKVVLPGFVDAHTHLVFAGNRLDDFERRARGKSRKPAAGFGQLLKKRARHRMPTFLLKQRNMQSGFCAVGRPRLKPSLATD